MPPRRLRRYTGPDLLILDELGYVPCDASAVDLLFRIVSKGHESRSVVITTNQFRDAARLPRDGSPALPTRRVHFEFPRSSSIEPLRFSKIGRRLRCRKNERRRR
ncbi:ATP-binding protein [Sorangium sp. So ce1151]|uniref:ATP-binding protein n=1 Tax=Sorangium sp. So ce1151 TaxID=3133332 RepID=UPI003F5E0AB6